MVSLFILYGLSALQRALSRDFRWCYICLRLSFSASFRFWNISRHSDCFYPCWPTETEYSLYCELVPDRDHLISWLTPLCTVDCPVFVLCICMICWMLNFEPQMLQILHPLFWNHVKRGKHDHSSTSKVTCGFIISSPPPRTQVNPGGISSYRLCSDSPANLFLGFPVSAYSFLVSVGLCRLSMAKPCSVSRKLLLQRSKQLHYSLDHQRKTSSAVSARIFNSLILVCPFMLTC